MRAGIAFGARVHARSAMVAVIAAVAASGCGESENGDGDEENQGGASASGGTGTGNRGGNGANGGSAGATEGGTGANAGTSGTAGLAGTGGSSTGGTSIGGASGAAGDGGDGGSGTGAEAGMGGACTTACSCEGLGPICQGESCCVTLPVTGGEMLPLGPGGDERPAAVDAFRLDKYEVTVGRFRRFVDAYDVWRAAGNPSAGAGAHPAIPGSGWQTDFDSSLPTSAASLVSMSGLLCYPEYQTWSDDAPTNDSLPINCVNWFVAFAFCIFDDARLPTEVEWETAAAGANENRDYPWGSTPIPDDLDGSRAVYNCLGDGTPGMPCTFTDILPVGSRPTGAGRFGQLDLSGSAWEWVLDWYADYPASVDRNYANVASGATRVYRGGSFSLDATNLLAAARFSRSQTTRSFGIGVRCARNP